MKAGVILTLRVAGLPAKVTGIYTENTGIILDGSIQLVSKGSLRAALEFLLQKSGYAVNLSFLPQLQAETVWMTYCQKTSEMGFGIRLWEGEKELGQIRAVVRAKEEKFLFCLSSVKTLQLSEIPVAGDFMGNGSLGPVECILESDGGMKLSLSYSYGDERGKALLSFPSDYKKKFLAADGSDFLSAVRWKSAEKSMGCVTLLAIGGAFSEGRLYVLLRAKLHLSILTVTLEGLGICIPFENLKNTFPMAGTGCVQIKKLAVGFGYNRFLSIPQIDRLRQFTLMKMMHGEISAG